MSFIILRQTANKCYRHADFYSFCIVWISAKCSVSLARTPNYWARTFHSLFSYLCAYTHRYGLLWPLDQSVGLNSIRSLAHNSTQTCSFWAVRYVFSLCLSHSLSSAWLHTLELVNNYTTRTIPLYFCIDIANYQHNYQCKYTNNEHESVEGFFVVHP